MAGTTSFDYLFERFYRRIEKDEDYYKASVERLKDAQSQLKLF